MDDIELAKLFVEYKETSSRLTQLRVRIEDAVMKKKESVKIAGVTATFYKPSTSYD